MIGKEGIFNSLRCNINFVFGSRICSRHPSSVRFVVVLVPGVCGSYTTRICIAHHMGRQPESIHSTSSCIRKADSCTLYCAFHFIFLVGRLQGYDLAASASRCPSRIDAPRRCGNPGSYTLRTSCCSGSSRNTCAGISSSCSCRSYRWPLVSRLEGTGLQCWVDAH